ncbi:MFS transporter [Helicobacter cetorum]|uniref:MFS transporter n=1 Tax=Helicobacter cetorum TaxID=138563 RepID=UPI000CF1A3CD|nr:MFS transporter [Helicobacter cetorum]
MHFNKNIFLLFLSQGFNGAVISLLTFSSPLAGKWFVEQLNKHAGAFVLNLSTLAVSLTLCGAFIAVFFSSNIIYKLGRKKAFLWSALVGVCGALLAILALFQGSFWLFCLATFLLGFFTALNGFYRFLVNEALKNANQNHAYKASALIVGGGILGGVLGPNLAHFGLHLMPTPFVGSFIFVLILCALNFLCTMFLELTPLPPKPKIKATLLECLKEPHFLRATLSCAVGFSLMTLMMNALPLSMAHYEPQEIKNVLMWHFIAMYAPSLLLAFLVKKLNPFRLIVIGMIFYGIAGIVALMSQDFWGFLVSLIFVGIAWSLSFNGGTFLFNSIQSKNQVKLQELNAIAIFGANLMASLSVGIILENGGELVLNSILLGSVCVFLVVFKFLKT